MQTMMALVVKMEHTNGMNANEYCQIMDEQDVSRQKKTPASINEFSKILFWCHKR